ncbi:MAG: toprim domain-containing protein, partial [Acidimicrobiales bacterium]
RDHQRRSRLHDALEAAVTWYHQHLLAGKDSSPARAYLRHERGYDGDIVRRYRLGWAPDGWDQMVRSLGVPPQVLTDAGLAYVNDRGRHTDFFRARLLFPIFEAGGRPVGAGGRSLPGARPPKYKNTSNTAVYDKSRVLYGLNWAKNDVVAKGQVVVCEGYTDVIGLHAAGIGEAVATCGTALADGHIRLLTNFARRVVLAYDADAAGQNAAGHYADWEQRFDIDIRVAALPEGADPADLARTDPDALRHAIETARPYLGFRLERLLAGADLTTPESRVRAATAGVALVATHPNEMVRDQYLMEVADRCRVEPGRLRAAAAEPAEPAPAARRQRRPAPEPRAEAPAVTGTELEALRLAVHRPDEIADRLEPVLLAHPLSLAVYQALAGSDTLHQAIDAADPQAADLLQRLAVEAPEVGTDDVMVRLVERAGDRAVRELQAEMRQAADPAAYGPTMAWLKLALETIRDADGGSAGTRDAEVGLVRWLVDRSQPDPAGDDRDGRVGGALQPGEVA